MVTRTCSHVIRGYANPAGQLHSQVRVSFLCWTIARGHILARFTQVLRALGQRDYLAYARRVRLRF